MCVLISYGNPIGWVHYTPNALKSLPTNRGTNESGPILLS